MTDPADTYHRSTVRVSWSVNRNNSILLFGEDEAAARADYERRRKTLHRGETIRLERVTTAEAWIQHTDVMDETRKPERPEPRLPDPGRPS